MVSKKLYMAVRFCYTGVANEQSGRMFTMGNRNKGIKEVKKPKKDGKKTSISESLASPAPVQIVEKKRREQ